MRLALFALALLSPVAGAAADPLAMNVVVAPFSGPVAPLTGLAETDVTATFSCALLANAAPGQAAVVQFAVLDGPSWAMPVVTPTTVSLEASRACDAATQTVVARTKLVATTLATAPAFDPIPIVVEATLQGPAGKQAGKGNATIEADWMSLLDLELESNFALVAPGEKATFKLLVSNLGNAPVDVLVSVEGVEPSWSLAVESPRGVAVGERREILVAVTPPEQASGPTTIALDALARLGSDPTRMGDTARTTLVVTVESPVGQLTRGLPAPPGALVALALVAGAVLARRVVK